MKIMIHAVPKRMWYVEGFLIPSLAAQGAAPEEITVWLDDKGHGCLRSCMESFASLSGEGGTWHLQDDVLVARDFVERCNSMDEGVVYGFCHAQWYDDPEISGRVYMPDAWHSFQCVRIPDGFARGCAQWVASGEWKTESLDPDLPGLLEANVGADSVFREFLQCRHGAETVTNARPNLVEHIDRLLGGSIANQWRGYWARSSAWDDEDLVEELRRQLKITGAIRAEGGHEHGT